MTTRAPAADARLSFLATGRQAGLRPEIVGAKAHGLMRMADAGLPVPPGFVLSTTACAEYHARGGRLDQDAVSLVSQGIEQIERATGRRFGGGRKPLLVAVRSGAPVSMPGMLETMLNVGLCDSTVGGLLRATGDMRFVWDSYRRLIESYAEVVDGCEPAAFSGVVGEALRREDVPAVGELDASGLQEVVGQLQGRYRSQAGRSFPQEPMDQLLGAVEGVMRSWNSPRAVEYRRLKHLTGLTGTAVVVQAMVFGNTGMTSGAGVGFTRNPATGRPDLYVDFLLNAQGEDVVSGRTAVADSQTLISAVPALADELGAVSRRLEAIFSDAQDFEFTVEDGKLWLLQTRTAKRTPLAALRIACDLADEGLIDEGTALRRLQPYDLDAISVRRLGPGRDDKPVGTGVPASAGTAVGRIALTVAEAQSIAGSGDPVILVRGEASTADIAALEVCAGLLTAAGARTSHAAVVARELGVACLVGCSRLVIDPAAGTLAIGDWHGHAGDFLTIDGASGEIYPGALRLVEERPSELIERVRGWQRRL